MPARNEKLDPLIEIASRIGELSGVNQAVLSELSRLNQELVRLGAEMDKKHEENIKRIEERHAQNSELLQAHKAEDGKNFDKIFKYFNYISGGAGLLVILWAIFKVLLPVFLQGKLGE